MTGQSTNGTTVNGAIRPQRVRTFEGFVPFQIGGIPTVPEPEPTHAPEPAVVPAQPAAESEPPKPLPAGVYAAVVDGPFTETESKEKKTPGAQFAFKLIQPINVADMDMLAKAGGCTGKVVKHTFYVTEASEFRLKKFLVDHLGIDPGEGSNEKDIGQMLSEAPGRQLAVTIKNEVRTSDGEARITYFVDGTGKL